MFWFSKKKKKVSILAPISGEIVPLENIPDEVFSSKMVGDGIGIRPTDGIIVAPMDGVIAQLFPTLHAILIQSKDGIEMLIHIGIDTVNLKGQGFESFVSKGDNVHLGDKLLKVDLDYINSKAKSLISPIIITNYGDYEGLDKMVGPVKKGVDKILEIQV